MKSSTEVSALIKCAGTKRLSQLNISEVPGKIFFFLFFFSCVVFWIEYVQDAESEFAQLTESDMFSKGLKVN